MPDRWEFSNECFRRGEKKLLCDIQCRKITASSSTAVTVAATAAAAAVVLPILSAQRTGSPSDSGEVQVISSSNSPSRAREFSGGMMELIGENERLMKENVQLNQELSQMKNLCNNIFNLMSNYSSSSNKSNEQAQSSQLCVAENTMKALDLLPMTTFCEEIQTAMAAAAARRATSNTQ